MKANAKVKKRIYHDSVSIDVKFPSGASFRYYASRSGERLTVAFSNDRDTLKKQTSAIKSWLDLYETYGEKIEVIERNFSKCVSGADVMEYIRGEFVSRMEYEEKNNFPNGDLWNKLSGDLDDITPRKPSVFEFVSTILNSK